MTIYKYGFPAEVGVENAMQQAIDLAAAESSIDKSLFVAEDITTADHVANREILIRVSQEGEGE